MAGKVKTIPAGWHSVTPFLSVKDAARAVEFYRKAFGATELERMEEPDGKVNHALLKIGDSLVRVSDDGSKHVAAWVAKGWSRSPQSLGGTPVHFYVYVDDSDAVFKRAIASGAKVMEPVTDKVWGDRTGALTDPFGHIWMVATHKKDVAIKVVAKHHGASSRAVNSR
jgi:PhnB protein